MQEGLHLVVDGSLFFPFVQLFLFVFGVIGLTHILVDGKIFQPVRDFLKERLPASVYSVLECYQCSGTWAGVLVGLLVLTRNPFYVVVCGFAGSFLASWAAFYLNYLEAQTMMAMQDDSKDKNGH